MQPERPQFMKALLVAAFGIAAIILADTFTRDITVFPLVGLSALFIVAWLCGPRLVFAVLVVLASVVAVQLWNKGNYFGFQARDSGLGYVRLLTFLGGGMIAILFAAYRQRFERAQSEMTKIFELIPLPILVGNSSGTITFASEKVVAMTCLAREEVIGAQVTDILGTQLLEEADEDWFNHWLQASEAAPFATEIRIGGTRAEAKAVKIGKGSQPSIALLLDDPPDRDSLN